MMSFTEAAMLKSNVITPSSLSRMLVMGMFTGVEVPELRQRAAERCARREPLPHLEFAMGAPVRYFVEVLLAQEARCTRTEAWTRLEGTRLMELLREDPALAWTQAPLLFQCWCMERDQGAVAMEVYLWEQTHPEG